MKKGKMVYVVMVNDAVDSVWTKETKALKVADKLHKPNPERIFAIAERITREEVHPKFARVENRPLNTKGKW